ERRRRLHEGAIALIPIEPVGPANMRGKVAPEDVATHVKVRISIAIEVGSGHHRTAQEAGRQPGRAGPVDEGETGLWAQVPAQPDSARPGDGQVGEAVLVVVERRAAPAMTEGGNSGVDADVSKGHAERAAGLVLVEHAGAWIVEKEQVGPAILVVV